MDNDTLGLYGDLDDAFTTPLDREVDKVKEDEEAKSKALELAENQIEILQNENMRLIESNKQLAYNMQCFLATGNCEVQR
jgi:hypothetical protein